MARDAYWADRAVAEMRGRIERNKDAMSLRLGRPVARRPNTSELLERYLTSPESYPAQGREALAQYARETYGESANMILPYLTGEE